MTRTIITPILIIITLYPHANTTHHKNKHKNNNNNNNNNTRYQRVQ